MNFAQDDLDNEDVMMLDVHYEVYLWFGSKANEVEKKFTLETVLEYVKTVEGRVVPPIYVIQAGREPASFTNYFNGWDTKKALSWIDPAVRPLSENKVRYGPGGKDISILEDLAPLKHNATEKYVNTGNYRGYANFLNKF
jgi:hypothetical protein